MANVWLYTLASVLVVSLISLIGVFTISISLKKLRKFTLFLVSFAAGSLLGGAFLHLLPEALDSSINVTTLMFIILAGIILFFALEKILFWRHCHIPTSEDHPHPLAVNNIIGDGFHNFVDGIIIAGSYLVSVPLGITTTIAVLLHEIPQEIGDFSILLHAGYSKKKALLFNFLSALVAVVGAVLAIIIGSAIINLQNLFIAFTIGGFIYIATADLMPELKSEEHGGRSIVQMLFLILGVGVMSLLLLLD